MGPLQVVVVDNSRYEEEPESLRPGLPSAIALLEPPENIGFGRACNLAFEQFEGELILLINPDAYLLPGCLQRLQETLSSTEKAGAVSPHVFWDEGLRFFLPPAIPPSLFQFQDFFDSWGQTSPPSKLLSALWRYHSVKIWRSNRPVKVKNLSGGLVLLKKEAVRKAGGLFDPRFFLYFEDTDLCIRLRKAGYTLRVDPRAKAVHYYDQCGRNEWEKKRILMDGSRKIFFEKHRKRGNLGIKRVMDRLTVSGSSGSVPFVTPDFTARFALKVPARRRKRWLFEVSPHATFIPSAARFGRGALVDFPKDCWDSLAPGQYFGRLGDPTGLGASCTVVSFVKNTMSFATDDKTHGSP